MNPFCFLVGCPRSGTRLLGRLVDAHPRVSVVHEARFVPGWYVHRRHLTSDGMTTPELAEALIAFERFEHFAVTPEEVRALAVEPLPYATFVATLFDRHARATGKPLVADKTPRYVRNLPTLDELFPEAKVVHLIRDGRDVGLSVASWRKVAERGELVAGYATYRDAPAATLAVWWERLVRLGREDGAPLGPGRYYELGYEALVADPAAECAALCAFLGVPYDDAMLGYPESGSTRHARRPPTPGMRKWRAQMPAADVERFEAAAGDLLSELGLPRAFPEPSEAAREEAERVRAWYTGFVREHDGRLPRRWQQEAIR